jgi:hypothetical protein
MFALLWKPNTRQYPVSSARAKNTESRSAFKYVHIPTAGASCLRNLIGRERKNHFLGFAATRTKAEMKFFSVSARFKKKRTRLSILSDFHVFLGANSN